ncbi:large ribosomal subunit protein eL22 [Diutina catenulata]
MAPITTKSSAPKKIVIDCSAPVENGVFDIEAYVKYLVEHIKIDGVLGQTADQIEVEQSGNKVVVVANAGVSFSGKYAKYLTKRFLKRSSLRDFVRFVSVKTNEYQLQFYSLAEDDDEEDDEE